VLLEEECNWGAQKLEWHERAIRGNADRPVRKDSVAANQSEYPGISTVDSR